MKAQSLPCKVLAEGALCVWFVAAFVWYFLQFKPLLNVVLRLLTRR
jgi:formate/nitrite transporter FocA (FNT family)